MTSIYNANYSIHFQEEMYTQLNEHVAMQAPSVIFVLVDENTMVHCYPYFMARLETTARIEIIEIDAGEQFKNIDTCAGVWAALVELGCDRNSLMINLGGGVVTDLGGFVASTIKRGIPFIHVPTSLLAMVDAAIGGKNGVDLGSLKNQIGVINPPIMTLIDTAYLRTLSQRELLNGSIEMFKHGLIADRVYWENMLSTTDYLSDTFAHLVYQSVLIKNEIASNDPTEKGPRKALNYGHTIGHAIESFCMDNDDQPDLLHGEAVAAGILLESHLSTMYALLPAAGYEEIATWYRSLNFNIAFNDADITKIMEYMIHDKKNVNGEVRFVLLDRIGAFKTDLTVPDSAVAASFKLLEP